MSVPDHADVVKTPRPDADAMDTGGSLSHPSHLSHVPRQPHERVSSCAPHRRPSCSACSPRWRSSRCRWSAPRTPAPHPVRSEVRRRRCTASSSPRSGRRAVRGSARAAFQARADGQQAAPGRSVGRPDVLVTRTGTARPSTCSASPGGPGRPPGRPHRPRAHPRRQGLDRLDRAGRAPTPRPAARARRHVPAPSRCGSATPTATRCASTCAAARCRAGLRVDLVDPGSSDADGAGRGRPADAVGAGRGGPADRSSRRAQWGADESLRGSRAEVQRHDQGRLRAPHGRHQRLLRGRGARRSCAASTRTTSRATAGRTSATTSSSTGSAGSGRAGTAASTSAVARRAHRRLQRRQLRGVGDRQLRQGRRARR